MSKDFALILTAAGKSQRFNNGKDGKKKEYVEINGKSVIASALAPFLSFPELKRIVITIPEGEENMMRSMLPHSITVPLSFVVGGNTRTESIKNAIRELKDKGDFSYIMVHDGARPFIDKETIERVLNEAFTYGAAVPGLLIPDALKRADKEGKVIEPVNRDNLYRIQTPQAFERHQLIKAYLSLKESESFNDDAELFSSRGGSVKIVEGSISNIKITWKSDLKGKERMRVGFGNDIHRLREGRKLWLGGIELDHTKGEVAHSDGDVLLHAIIDALLGAKALGDIGSFFPPEDEKWKDADSKELLKVILNATKPEIINLDATITLEGYKLRPHIDEIRESLSSLLSISTSIISVKAKTNEGMGELGKGEAIKAEVVILINEA